MAYSPVPSKLEDSAHASGDAGVPFLAVRQDADTSPVGSDGDYQMIQTNQFGRVKVSTTPAMIAATTGNITTSTGTVVLDAQRVAAATIYVTGTFSGFNGTFEASIDGGTTYFGVWAARTNANTQELTTGVIGAAPAYAWKIGNAGYTHIRIRATALTSGTVAVTISPSASAIEPNPVVGTHAVTGSGNFAVTMAANATTTPSKARDGVAGASDTGIPAWFIRRDTPTALTPAAGDWEAAQIDANGSQWVRSSAELADDSAFTPGTSRVLPVGLQADETSTDSVDEGDIGAPRMTLDRKQIVTPQAHTQGGATPYKLISAGSTNATSVKASAGQIYSIVATNTNAAVRYLKLYNKASSPTVGTDVPVQVYALPGATTGGGMTLSIPVGMAFGTGIAFAITTGAADSDTGAVAANEIIVNLAYL